MPRNDMLTVEDVAARLHLSPKRVREKIRLGQIPATRPFRRWLVRESDLEELLARSNPK